jgi:hypothetical protein
MKLRPHLLVAVILGATAAASAAEELHAPSGSRPFVDTKTFMEHVLTPAAKVIWRVNGIVIDSKGEHDLAPRTDDDWEDVVSGAATLAEATNALRLPQRALDGKWDFYVDKLAAAADEAYQAAEAHDLKTVSQVSDRLDGICAACHRHYGLE